MKKLGPNDPCPCGSGKKLKKCCAAGGVVVGYTLGDQISAYQKLHDLVDTAGLAKERDDAAKAFQGGWELDDEEPLNEVAGISDFTLQGWLCFDHRYSGGNTLAELALAGAGFTAGERNFLIAAGSSAMRLYRVQEAESGVSIKLQDAVSGDCVTVLEEKASTALGPGDWIAARVVGLPGRLSLEQTLPFMSGGEELQRTLKEKHAAFLREHPGEDEQKFYKERASVIHDAWMVSMFGMDAPGVENSDGEAERGA